MIEKELRDLLAAEGSSPDLVAAEAQRLVVHAGEKIEQDLLEIVQDRGYLRPSVQAFATRILVERDRNRDPADLLVLHPNSSKRGLLGYFTAGDDTILSLSYGLHRLYRLDPVNRLRRILVERYWWRIQCRAVDGLGDTGSLDALAAIGIGITNKNPQVRAASGDAFRRLCYSVGPEVVKKQNVGDVLERALLDSSQDVRIAAARTCAVLGEIGLLRGQMSRNVQDRDEISRIIDGDIPPLVRTWPGDIAVL